MNESKSKGAYRRKNEDSLDEDRRRRRNEHLGHVAGMVDAGMRAFFADRQMDRPSISKHLIFKCHTGGVRVFVSRLKEHRDRHALANTVAGIALPALASDGVGHDSGQGASASESTGKRA